MTPDSHPRAVRRQAPNETGRSKSSTLAKAFGWRTMKRTVFLLFLGVYCAAFAPCHGASTPGMNMGCV